MVRAATPDAVLAGVEVLAEAVHGDLLVIDVGGATTDVYSVISPQAEDAGLTRDVVAPLWHARTVEADLGLRWNAEGIVEAARGEQLLLPDGVEGYAARLVRDPAHLPHDRAEQELHLPSPRRWRSSPCDATPECRRPEAVHGRSPTSCT